MLFNCGTSWRFFHFCVFSIFRCFTNAYVFAGEQNVKIFYFQAGYLGVLGQHVQ